MSVKKLLILSAAALISTSALAGGASNYTAPAASKSSIDSTGLYVGVNGGWAQLDWKNQDGQPAGTSWNNAGSNGSLTLGADMGYSFNQYLAVELGGFWLPTDAKFTVSGSSISFQTWDLYLAGKATMPVYDNVDLFGKFGLAYTRTTATVSGSTTSSGKNNYMPMFAAGLGYDFLENWNANVQYALILGRQSNGSSYSANQNIYTLGVAYTFAM